MKNTLYSIVIIAVAGLTACSTPEEKALEYLESGQELLASGDIVEARLDFQNALQLNQNLSEAWYGLALISEGSSNWEEMYGRLLQVLEIDPDHLQARIRKGRLLLGAGQLDGALEDSNLSMGLAPENPDVLALRAAIFFRLEDLTTASQLAELALEADPEHPSALAVLATTAMQNEEYANAQVWIERGIEADRENPALYLLKIQILTALEETSGVENEYQRLIELFPETEAFRHELANFYINSDRREDAEAIFRSIMLENPESLDAKLNVIRFVNSTQGIEEALAESEKMVAADPQNIELLFMQSQLYHSADRQEQVGEILQRIIEQAPSIEDQLRAKNMIASLKWQSGNTIEAERLIEEILAQDPRNEDALILKATRSIESNQLVQAIAELRTVLRDTPDSARSLALLGRAHELDGSPELADDVFERAVSASNFEPEFSLAYGQFLNRRGNLSRAADVLETSRRLNPDHIELLTYLAQLRLNQGNFTDAQEIANHLRSLDDAGSLSEEILGGIYAGQQDYQQSIDSFRQAVATSPDNLRPMVSLVRAYLASGREAEARNFLQNALNINETSGVRLLLGQLEASLGNYELAKEYIRLSISTNSRNAAAYSSLVSLIVKTEGVDAAVGLIDEGIDNNPNNFELAMIKAGILESMGDYEGAISQYETILSSQPNAEVVVNNLASLLSDYRQDQDSLQRANSLAQRFRRSNIPHFMDTLGWTYYRLGNFEDATNLIEDAVELMPTIPVFRYHLGKVYMDADNRSEALEEFRVVLSLAEDSGNNLPFLPEVEALVAEL